MDDYFPDAIIVICSTKGDQLTTNLGSMPFMQTGWKQQLQPTKFFWVEFNYLNFLSVKLVLGLNFFFNYPATKTVGLVFPVVFLWSVRCSGSFCSSLHMFDLFGNYVYYLIFNWSYCRSCIQLPIKKPTCMPLFLKLSLYCYWRTLLLPSHDHYKVYLCTISVMVLVIPFKLFLTFSK